MSEKGRMSDNGREGEGRKGEKILPGYKEKLYTIYKEI